MQTKPLPTLIRCKAYTAPPNSGGRYICTIEPSTYLGPVERVLVSNVFVTILVRGYWINVWKARVGGFGNSFAYLVDEDLLFSWHLRGWQDLP